MNANEESVTVIKDLAIRKRGGSTAIHIPFGLKWIRAGDMVEVTIFPEDLSSRPLRCAKKVCKDGPTRYVYLDKDWGLVPGSRHEVQIELLWRNEHE